MEAETTESLDIQGWKVPDSKDPILLWLGKDKLCLGPFNLDFFFLFPWIYVYIGLEFLGGCCSVTMSHFLQPHGLQHIRLPCPSLSPWVCSNSRSLSRWLHPAISFCHPLLFLPSIFPSIRVFSNESFSWHQVAKVLELQLQICPFNEYSRLISFRINCFDLLAVQGTLKSLLQHYSSKASILRCSDFFMVQISHPYLTIGNTIALTIWTKWWQSDVSAF